MKKISTLENQVLEDMSLMEEFLHKDGEVPPVIFIHFKKLNRKIANMMNKVPAGKLKVKQGFFLSLNEPMIMSVRKEFMRHLGAVIAALNVLNVLEEPEAIIFCSEGWASTKNINEKLTQRPSEDPKAKDVFIGSGTNNEGEKYIIMKEKHLKMVEIDGKKVLKPELIHITTVGTGDAYTTVLEPFFESYHNAHKKMKKDKTYTQFSRQAEEDPVEAFRQGIEAVMMMARLAAMRSVN